MMMAGGLSAKVSWQFGMIQVSRQSGDVLLSLNVPSDLSQKVAMAVP